MSAGSDFVVFMSNGERHLVSAPSLRAALARFNRKPAGEIVAACEAGCMPVVTDARPFLAVFLKSPNFVPPEVAG